MTDHGEPMATLPRLEPLTDVWIPSQPVVPGAAEVRLELFGLTEGEPPVMLAYRTLEDLRASCGEHQPAVSVRADLLPEVIAEAGAAGVRFDVVLDDDVRYARPIVDWRLAPVCDDPWSEEGRTQWTDSESTRELSRRWRVT